MPELRAADPAQLQRRTLAMEFRAVDENAEEGIIEGYGSVFGEVDSYGTVMDKGCFKATIKGRAKKIKMFFQHKWDDLPVGIWLEMSEDDHGLKVKGRLALTTQLGKDIWELIKIGAIDGLSIGFYPIRHEVVQDGDVVIVHFKEVKMVETSIVNFPACEPATISDIRTVAGDIGLDLADLTNAQLLSVRAYIRSLKSTPVVETDPPIVEASTEQQSEERHAVKEQSEDPQLDPKLLQSLEQLRQAFTN